MDQRFFKNFIFDIDGTILDSRFATIEAFERMTMKKIGRPLTTEEKSITLHLPVIDVLAALKIEANAENMGELFAHFDELAHGIGLFEGMEEVLTQVKARANFMAFATNRDRTGSHIVLDQNGLDKFFDTFVCKDDVENPKPSGDMLVLLMKENNLDPEETIYIGNALSDHLAAIDAGIAYGASEWGTDEYLNHDKILLKEPADILKLLYD